ncbi:magnesium transporter CorA family protein [Enterococcus aquimarinus]|uniref:Magnesium transporter n=1 Tax=Enterococcus aquimarinus TaxID=328396 RepID=A0A1L8QRY8_9ENTE|nr:magnesium transporter CorA family protein [Enterococcus aquimarinus]OJG10260.1 magnesium transporter [Enterococcus aquimarinus]
MFSYFTISNQQLVEQPTRESSTIWTHISNPSEKVIHQLAKEYNVPHSYFTSILDDAENSRSEGLQQLTFHKAVLVLLQFPHEVLSSSGFIRFDTYPLALIITPDLKIITVSKQPPLFFNFLREHVFPENDITPTMNLFLQVLWRLVTAYNHSLTKIKAQLDELEGQIQVSTENKQLYQLLNLQKSLVLFDAATAANFKTLKGLSETKMFEQQHAYHNHLHDILVEVSQAMTSVHIQLQLVQQMNNTFSAVVSNNLNNVMKILTSLTIVLTIPTIVGGMYGMNVPIPFAEHKNAFLFITFLTILLCAWTIAYLKKKNLL